MRPVNVVQLVASSRGGGAVHVRDLVSGLDAGDFAPQVAMPEDGGNVRRDDFAVPFHRVDIAAGLSLKAMQRIRSLASGADILHVHGARAALFGRLAALPPGKRRPRVIYTIHGFAAPRYPVPKRQALLLLERALAPITDAWICVSHAEKSALLAAGIADLKRAHVIWNGIDVDRFARINESHAELRNTIHVPEDAFVITTIGRLHPMPHDFRTLLHGFRLVRDANSNAHLLVVGDGPLRSEIEQMIAALMLQDSVHLLGMRHDVPQILSATDVFVLSSIEWTGLPLTVLEAMASSLPVVVSNVGGTREQVVDGVTGYLFSPGDAKALAQHVGALAADPDQGRKMGRHGLARVKEHFAVQRMARQTAALYHQLLDGERRLAGTSGT